MQRKHQTSRTTKTLVGLMSAFSFSLAALAVHQLGPDMISCSRLSETNPSANSEPGSGNTFRRTVVGGSLTRKINSKKLAILRDIPGSPAQAVISVDVTINSSGTVEISKATARAEKTRETDVTSMIREFVPLGDITFPSSSTMREHYEIEISR